MNNKDYKKKVIKKRKAVVKQPLTEWVLMDEEEKTGMFLNSTDKEKMFFVCHLKVDIEIY
jgi:hypothetical protein